MKLIELLNKIANGEIKEGTKIKIEGNKTECKILDGNIVQADDFGTYFLVGRKMLNEEVEIIEEKQQGRWKPKEGEKYWSIDSCHNFDCDEWLNDEADKWRYVKMSKITITNIIVDDINKCKWLVDGVCSNYKSNFICPCFCTRPQSKGIDCAEGCCEFFEKEDGIVE